MQKPLVRFVVSDVGSAHWAAVRGTSGIHLTERAGDVEALCGFAFPIGVILDVFRGFLPRSWKYGYTICGKCETHVAIDLGMIAEHRRPLAVDELPTAVLPAVQIERNALARRIPVPCAVSSVPGSAHGRPWRMVAVRPDRVPGTAVNRSRRDGDDGEGYRPRHARPEGGVRAA